MAVREVDAAGRRVLVALTREQVERSPDVDTHRPVSRQHEIALLQHYGFPTYWYGPYPWGPVMFPAPPLTPSDPVADEFIARQEQDTFQDAHLRSSADVVGYAIQARDCALGHLYDFLMADPA